jgi:hypothetical protein
MVMGLDRIILDAAKDNLDFLIASATYLAGSASDYLMTSANMMAKSIEELNPVVNSYITLYGTEDGLLISKSLLAAGILVGAKAIDMAHKKKLTGLKSEYLLYPGACLTAGSFFIAEGLGRLAIAYPSVLHALDFISALR